ncbi:MAG: Pre-mRNA-splicing factor cef1 [Alyxoria varia]|nr:MAG: Pre-mRNA-splicing factor cef1 [Alyxoria varia]
MPVVKGGVWTNIEDEILKASVSKYGLNQWARVSSLLARKTPKQCKARWSEWLDPSIRKIEWSKEEDEKLLHLAKLMPTQWRTIAPIVGRTATQCLERYQKLLDEAEARENDDMGLAGPEGGETQAPSADDVRRLRPGELDPDPESKPARPDTIDLDEDEKEMLSEARARLANTQGKKAKRKARERQLEESRRLASLQKRRELKSAGINIKINTRKPGQMDYNADVPFEKGPAPGFYDTVDEQTRNERQREMFDPRKQQLANKRKGDQQDDGEDRKRQKNDKNAPSQAFAAATKAGQMQKIREAERSSKRKSLNLPAPQVGEDELEDIVKMGMAGERANQSANASESDTTRSLVGNYSGMVGNTPIRTPRAPQEEDRVANEIRNARARTDTQSALLGGDNPDVEESSGTTGYEGVTPSKQQTATPNPMATPLRQANGVGGATPAGAPGATPRTPRDNFRLNDQTPQQLPGQTPREVKLAQAASKNSLRSKLSALPKPREEEWELELPDEKPEAGGTGDAMDVDEDSAVRDAREAALKAERERAEFKRQTQVVQRGLPIPKFGDGGLDLEQMIQDAKANNDVVGAEVALLMANDAKKFGGSGRAATSKSGMSLTKLSDEGLERARMEIAMEESMIKKDHNVEDAFNTAWNEQHGFPEPSAGEDESTASREALGPLASLPSELYPTLLEEATNNLMDTAEAHNATEKRLQPMFAGYQAREKTLIKKIKEGHETLEKLRIEENTALHAQVSESAAIQSRLERLRELVTIVNRRERVAQEEYKKWKDIREDAERGIPVPVEALSATTAEDTPSGPSNGLADLLGYGDDDDA